MVGFDLEWCRVAYKESAANAEKEHHPFGAHRYGLIDKERIGTANRCCITGFLSMGIWTKHDRLS